MSILKPKVFWPLTITSANRVIPYKYLGVDYTVNVATGTYLSPAALAAAVDTAWDTSVIPSPDSGIVNGKFRFASSSGAPWTFRGSQTTNSAYVWLGFFASDIDDTVGVVDAPKQHENAFYSPVAVADDTGAIRDRQMDIVTRALSGQTKFITEVELAERQLRFRFLPPEYTYIANEGGSGDVNKAIERWWASGRARFRYFPDGADDNTWADYVLSQESARVFQPRRQFTRKALFEIDFRLLGYVA